MSMTSELTFFKQARKGRFDTSPPLPKIGDGEPEIRCFVESLCGKAGKPACSDFGQSCANGQVHSRASYFEHSVNLPASITEVVTCLQSEYRDLLDCSDAILRRSNLDSTVPKVLTGEPDQIEALLCVAKETALKRMSPRTLHRLLSLFVLQQTAKILCSYGIRVAYHYLESLLRSMAFSCMRFLERWVPASRKKLQQASDILESSQADDHPKLTILRNILQRSSTTHGAKFLILAERRAFFTLLSCLQDLNLTAFEVDTEEKLIENEHGKISHLNQEILNQEIQQALTSSDCILLPQMYVSTSLPFREFSVVILYDAVPFSLKKTEKELDYLWRTASICVHKLIVEFPVQSLDHKDTTLETSQPPRNDESNQKDEIRSSIHAHSSGQAKPASLQDPKGVRNLQFQNQANVQNARTVSGFHVRPDSREPSGQGLGLAGFEPNSTQDNKRTEARDCNLMIVVNAGRRLLMHRRTWYLCLLSNRREHVKIVERQFSLPVDLILSAATCLTVYTPEGFGIMVTHDCQSNSRNMEIVIREHMQAINKSFQIYVLIFEGPRGFTSAAQQLSDELSTASSELHINLQCYVSDSAQTTDTIIKGCVEAVLRTRRIDVCPVMPEFSTQEEAFLTSFPSINHLSAHAILSCGMSLPRFLLLTFLQQVEATEPFGVHLDGLKLFKVQYNSGNPHAVLPAQRTQFPGFPLNSTSSARNDPDPCSSFVDFPPAYMIRGNLEDENQDEHDHPTPLLKESISRSGAHSAKAFAVPVPPSGSIMNSEGKKCAIEKWIRAQNEAKVSSKPLTVDDDSKRRRLSVFPDTHLPSMRSSQATNHSPSKGARISKKGQPPRDPHLFDKSRHIATKVPENGSQMISQSMLGLQESTGLHRQTASPFMRSWTPHDKRAKKVLTFQKQGHQSQSFLVWEKTFGGLSK